MTVRTDNPADLRRKIDELENSLSWKITAPLRYVSKPLFRAKMNGNGQPEENGAVDLPVKTIPNATAPAAVPAPAGGTALQEVCARYSVHPDFAHAALEKFAGADYERTIAGLDQSDPRYARLTNQLEYTFTTAVRGKQLVTLLEGWGVPLRSKGQYLDIGFAYGGSLASFASIGYQVTGIEISEELARLGRVNLASGGHRAQTLVGDFLAEEPLGGESRFDLITCCDVIEHVADPEAALRKICRLLKPGGTAYIAYPTKLSIPYVRSDTHCQLFGLTLLDYYRARAAFTMYTGWPQYEISDFYEPEWYLNIARTAGAHAEIVYDESLEAPDVAGEIAQLFAAFAEWQKSGALKLEPLMRREITVELAKYSARLFQEYSEHVAHNSVDLFARKWIDRLTRILVKKP